MLDLIPASAQETSPHLAETSCPRTGVGKDRKIYINIVLHTWSSFMRTNVNSGRVIHVLWLRKTGPWKSSTLFKAPERANRRSRIRVNRAANISSSHPTDHSRKVPPQSKLHKAKISQEQANLAKLCRVWFVGQEDKWKPGDNDP